MPKSDGSENGRQFQHCSRAAVADLRRSEIRTFLGTEARLLLVEVGGEDDPIVLPGLPRTNCETG